MPSNLKRLTLRVLELLVILGALATIPLTILEEQEVRDDFLSSAGWLLWAVFALDYFVGLVLSPNRRGYARSNWLGLAIVILSFPAMPGLLEIVRLARLSRLIRIARLPVLIPKALHSFRLIFGKRGVPYLLGTIALVTTGGGALLALVEPERAPGGLWDGMWWAVVTVTTVGYGDIAPGTAGGRLIAVVLMFTGIGLTATLAACVAAHFIEQEEGADLRSLAQRLDRMELLLGKIAGEQRRDATIAASGSTAPPAAEQ